MHVCVCVRLSVCLHACMCVCNRILLEFPITSGILFSQFSLKSAVRCFSSFVWCFNFEGKKIFHTKLLIKTVKIPVEIVCETKKNKTQKWLMVSDLFEMRKKSFFGYVHFGLLFQQRMKIEVQQQINALVMTFSEYSFIVSLFSDSFIWN